MNDPELIASTYQGYRLFMVDGHRLGSIFAPFMFEPGRNFATCHAGEEHDPPGMNCKCGFWLYHHQHRARAQFQVELEPPRPANTATVYGDFGDAEDEIPDVVLGKVEGGGRAIVGDDGARVAMVKVVALVTDNATVFTSVLDHYGIPAVPPTPMTRGWIVKVTGNEVTIETPTADPDHETGAFFVDDGVPIPRVGSHALAEFERRESIRWVTSFGRPKEDKTEDGAGPYTPRP